MPRNPSHKTYERRWNEHARQMATPATTALPPTRYTDAQIMAMPWGKADKTRALKANELERQRERVRLLLAAEDPNA